VRAAPGKGIIQTVTDMVIRLWWPDDRCLGGVRLGSTRDEVLALGEYFEDHLHESGGDFLQRFSPDVIVSVSDGIVVCIGASDQCLLDDVELIGTTLDLAAAMLGGISEQTHTGEVEIYETGSGVELYVRDGRVCRVLLSDWSLIPED
jgi:hypothetical protein